MFAVAALRSVLAGLDVAAKVETSRLFAPAAAATCFAMSCANLRAVAEATRQDWVNDLINNPKFFLDSLKFLLLDK